MSRLLQELRRGHSTTDVDAALATLVVRVEDGTAIVSRAPASEHGTTLFGCERTADVVRIEPHVHAATPTSGARVRLLAAAAAIAQCIELHAPLASDGTYIGRLVVDVPRRAARALGVSVPEPGDRFAGDFVHAFFDDEALILEAARAGLRFVARRGSWIILERDGSAHGVADELPFTKELGRVLRTVRAAERQRLSDSPERAVSAMRERGRRAGRRRGPIGRARLRRAIGWLDAAFPGGPNCFRRTLVEVALDAGAAGETLVFGLDVGKTGHVAFKDAEDRTFDVAFEVPADDANGRDPK